MSAGKRPRLSEDAAKAVADCFTREGEGTPPKCNICSKVLQIDKYNNLKRHLESVHNDVFDDIVAAAETTETFRPKRKIPSVSVPIDRELLVEYSVKMVTTGGLAFNMLDQPGLADLLGTLTKALKVPSINRKTIPDDVEKTAMAFKEEIKRELKGRMICLKVDSASRKGRNLIAICVQYIVDSKFVLRTLAVVDFNASQTAEALRDEILRVLNTFEVEAKQIYSITTDNGANYLKASRLIHEAQKGSDAIDYDLDLEETDEQCDGINDEECALESITNAISDSVRCAAHTLQLSVYDAIKKLNLKPSLDRIKATARQLRTKQFRRIFDQSGVGVPKLDCETRWNSAYIMLEYFAKNEQFLRDLIEENNHVQLIEEDWLFITEFVQSFQPVYNATVRLQNETLIMGDFFFIWLECALQLEEMNNNNMACTLVAAMHSRQAVLFEGKAFLAALYLDPRINYADSEFLTEEQKSVGLQHLKKVWERIKVDINGPITSADVPSSSNTPVSRIEAMLRKKDCATDQSKQTVDTKLREMPLRPRLPSSASVIEYYWNQKRTEPILYSLAQVALAVPCTQVSAERSFSALGLVLTDKRLRLSDKNLSNILLVKLNTELFDKVEVSSSPKK